MPTDLEVKYATLDSWILISGMGRSTTYQALAAGHMRAKKAGTRLLIDVEAGLAYIRSLPDARIELPNSRRPIVEASATPKPKSPGRKPKVAT
jgi:hypothetical protein